MPAPIRPGAAKTYGRENYIYIPLIADTTGLAPTVAEATAASAIDITLIAFEGATPEVNATTNRVKQDRRAGDTSSFEFVGETSYEGGDVMMAWSPQAAAGSDGKKAWAAFPEGTTGFYAKREDVDRDTAVTAGQTLSWVLPVEMGPPIPMKQGSGEAAQSAFRSTFAVTGQPQFDVQISA